MLIGFLNGCFTLLTSAKHRADEAMVFLIIVLQI